jgi:hypothetical protein
VVEALAGTSPLESLEKGNYIPSSSSLINGGSVVSCHKPEKKAVMASTKGARRRAETTTIQEDFMVETPET